MFPDISKEARWASRSVGFDRYPCNAQTFLVRLDKCIDDVAKSGCDIDLIQCFSRIGAETADGVGDFFTSDEADDIVSDSLEESFKRCEMRIRPRTTVSDHHFRFSGKDGFDEFSDLIAWILIVCIGIHDDISSEHEAMHDTMMECSPESSIAFEIDDMMHAQAFRYLSSPIRTPVIDHQKFEHIDPINLLR